MSSILLEVSQESWELSFVERELENLRMKKNQYNQLIPKMDLMKFIKDIKKENGIF